MLTIAAASSGVSEGADISEEAPAWAGLEGDGSVGEAIGGSEVLAVPEVSEVSEVSAAPEVSGVSEVSDVSDASGADRKVGEAGGGLGADSSP